MNLWFSPGREIFQNSGDSLVILVDQFIALELQVVVYCIHNPGDNQTVIDPNVVAGRFVLEPRIGSER